MEILAVRNLTFTYPGAGEPALRDVSFAVEAGEFVTLAGPSGGGKTTLLRQFKASLAPHGERTGDVLFAGEPLAAADERAQAAAIGFVQQSPENQLVTDKVWHELAFGLESLGCDTRTIRSRVAEMASFFGIQNWFYKNVSELSGGQKQLLNLASVMAMQPQLLILDEPTSQLDPIAASDFLAALGKINRELGTTILLTEHRLEEVFPLSSRVLVLDGGALLCAETPPQAGEYLRRTGHALFRAMPTPMRVWAAVENALPCPVTVREGRTWLDAFAADRPLGALPAAKSVPEPVGEPAVLLDEVWFRYEKDAPDVIKGLTVRAWPGELLCILGGNGTGKTTALSLLSGLHKPYRGDVRVAGRVAALPQDPQTLFVRNTVREDLEEMLEGEKLAPAEKRGRVCRVSRLCGLDKLLERHPYDLSGGEQQRAALAKVLLLRPRVLLLDEPTKGLDAAFQQTFAAILRRLTADGVCVVMVSHDIEFCAEHADRCALFFDGAIVTENRPRAFFAGNSFYTTSANRMARHRLPEAVTASDVIAACGGRPEPEPELPAGEPPAEPEEPAPAEQRRKTPLWRRILIWISGCAALGAFLWTLCEVDLTEILTTGDLTASSGGYRIACIVFAAALAVLALCVGRRTEREALPPRAERRSRRLPKRTWAAMGMILLAVPVTIFVGIRFLGDRRYYFISLLVILETMLPFALVFESRKPRARELVIIAVLCAVAVAARAAFIALPGFKPVMAVVIISGVAFGGESGFLVGAVAMFVSNMLFGQGPWTPWQMFAMGIIGFLAGVLFRKGLLRRDRLSLTIFGVLCAVIVYGGLMNPASVLMVQPHPTWAMILTAYATGFPVDLVHAAATAVLLWFFSRPMLEKLDRVKVKYGLIEEQE